MRYPTSTRPAILGWRLLLSLLGLLVTSGAEGVLAAEGEPVVPRPPGTVQAAVDKADADIAKLAAESAARIAKVRQGLIGTLTKAQTEATKKGDLDLALFLKQAIQEQQAKVAAGTEERAGAPGGGTAAGSSGIKVAGDGHPEIWDNQQPYQMSTSSHQLSAFLKLPSPTKVLLLRARPGYGCERIVWTAEGQGETRLAREFTFTFKIPKEVVRLDGDHRGSNDAFSYGPLQYRLSQEGEWQDIPATHLAPR